MNPKMIDKENEKPDFIKEVLEAFVLIDKNHDGKITEEELNEVVQLLGFPTSPGDVKKMIKAADTNGNGTVEFNEFVDLMRRYKEKQTHSPEKLLRDVFNIFDQNHDSFIDRSEIKTTMRCLGEDITDEDVEAMILEADMNHDGLVNFEEFKHMVTLVERLKRNKRQNLSRCASY